MKRVAGREEPEEGARRERLDEGGEAWKEREQRRRAALEILEGAEVGSEREGVGAGGW